MQLSSDTNGAVRPLQIQYNLPVLLWHMVLCDSNTQCKREVVDGDCHPERRIGARLTVRVSDPNVYFIKPHGTVVIINAWVLPVGE